MRFLLAVAIVALLIPPLTGGSHSRLAFGHWRQRGLLISAIGIQLALALLHLEDTAADIGFGLLVGSYVLLLGFVLANLVRTGMVVMGIGIAANALCVTLNHGMPVDPPESWADRIDVTTSVLRHPYDDREDTARFLAAIVPVPGLDEMVSFGDLILTVGLLDAVYHASRPARRRRGIAHPDDRLPPLPVDDDIPARVTIERSGDQLDAILHAETPLLARAFESAGAKPGGPLGPITPTSDGSGDDELLGSGGVADEAVERLEHP